MATDEENVEGSDYLSGHNELKDKSDISREDRYEVH